MSQDPIVEKKNNDFELLKNYLENYDKIDYVTSHCLGGEHFPITGNMYGYHAELSRGEVWNKITLALYLTKDSLPTCIFSVKNHHGEPCAMDTLFEVYKPTEKDNWKIVILERIKEKLKLIDKNFPIVYSHDFHRLVKAELPEDLKDYEVLTLNLQEKKDDNPLPHSNDKENIDQKFVFGKVPNLKQKHKI
jgi:hypothetical protein